MRRVMIVCLAMLLTLGAARQGRASEGFEDLVQLVKAGVNESTLLGYVNESPVAYALTVDEILYLSDLGMSAETIEAIDAHGRTLAAAASGAVAPAPSVATVLEQVGAENEPPAPGPGAVPAVEALPAQDVVQETVMAPPVETAPPADAADYSTFYETLAPYGNWVDLDGEWCWQPTTVLADPGWSPYCQGGHWVYTDYGWAWQSSYSWGWAPFHYGRWRHHPRYGWLWRPDRVWGPAWVCWRYSDEAIGWAPLPPEITFDAGLGLCFQGRAIAADFNCGLGWDAYTFVPVDRFSDIGVGRHRFERSRGERMFHSAGVVQNRIANQNGRLINVGPPLNRIAAVTHQDIHPVTIVAQNLRAGDPIPRPRLSGSTLTLFRPPIAPTAHENPRQVVVQSEARAREARHTTLADDVFRMSRNGINVQGEQARGRESRSTPPTEAHPREQSHQADDAARQHQGEAAAHQHQAEAAAHQHQAEAAAQIGRAHRLNSSHITRSRMPSSA